MDRDAVTGVILAGGRATRLGGIAKGLLEKDGRPLVTRTAATLAEVSGDRLLLVADDAAPYAELGLETIGDAIVGAGPAGGLLAALEHVRTPFAIVVACDMPHLTRPLLELLRDRDARFDVVIPEVGGLVEPLCARWAARAAPALRGQLARGVRKMSALLEGLEVEVLSETVLRTADAELEFASNVNTADDADRLGLVHRKRPR